MLVADEMLLVMLLSTYSYEPMMTLEHCRRARVGQYGNIALLAD